MGRKRFLSSIAVLAALTMVAAACGGAGGDGGEPAQQDQAQAERGGTLRVNTDGFAFTGGFDPTGEYWGIAWTLYTNMLLRTLVNYPQTAGAPGQELVPDLAEEIPEPTNGGTTYEFQLKDGIRFGPPVNREITSQDIEFAFRRIATESLVAQYGSYYEGVIEGLEIGREPQDISGIETPDDKTIIFHLTEPTHDFLYRLAMPATAPMPEEVAGCFDRAGDYGRHVVSSGPYMIRGSEEQGTGGCNSLRPLSGFNPDEHLYLDRNPEYDPATDDPEIRRNYVNSMEVDLNTNARDIYNRIRANELDLVLSSANAPPDVLREYSTSNELRDRLKIGNDDRTWYITMNLAEPPFDDIHVRKAVNHVMDKESMLRAWGGQISGDIATHIQPPNMTGGRPTGEEYNPYPYSVEQAKEEMRQSRYDSDGDGVCDADVCQGVIMINRNLAPWTTMEPAVQNSLSEIGIDVEIRALNPDAAYTTIQTVARQIPIALNPGWGKDYPDSASFVGFLFDGRTIAPTGNYNYSLVGMTRAQAREFGVPYPEDGIPSVNSDIDECVATATEQGPGSEAALDCWVGLDQRIMEDVVPWVPYLWPTVINVASEAVTAWDFAQFGGYTAWSQVAVDPSRQE